MHNVERTSLHRILRHSTLRIWQTTPRTVRYLLFAIVFLSAFVGFHRGRTTHLDRLKKAYPTDFSSVEAVNTSLCRSTHPIRYDNVTHIDDQYTFIHHLGSGQEGSVSFYKSIDDNLVAIKTFSLTARNEIPHQLVGDFAHITTTWPSELEAGLLLINIDNASFVPVLDYFISQTSDGWHWALVTPLMPGGTLLNLVQREKTASHPRSTEFLDRTYRRSLENLLLTLEELHRKNLCHDDIKPDNIFISDDRTR